jgi:hypothetical protein
MKIFKTITVLVGVLGFTTAAMALPPPGNEQGSSHGQPFLSLQEQIDETNAALDALAADNDARLTQLETDVLNLQADIAALQAQIDANDGDIESLQEQIDELTAELLTKQDALVGSCPAGSSLRVIYADGTYLCEYDDTQDYVSRTVRYGYLTWVGSAYYDYTSVAYCPSGWFASGGGSDAYYSGWRRGIAVMDSFPYSNGWRVSATRTYEGYYGNYIRAVAMCVRTYH